MSPGESHVRIHRGRFIGPSGEPEGHWHYFLDEVSNDGIEVGFGCTQSYYQAILDAQEWADFEGIPVVDLTDEVAR